MAATNRFISKSTPTGNFTDTSITEGASTTATDYVELRVLITKADGTTATKLTVTDVLKALEHFKRYLIKGGKQLLGSNLPLPGPTS